MRGGCRARRPRESPVRGAAGLLAVAGDGLLERQDLVEAAEALGLFVEPDLEVEQDHHLAEQRETLFDDGAMLLGELEQMLEINEIELVRLTKKIN